MKHNKQSGFTLVELSIVIVVIGLIIGGISLGQNMIRASQLRAVAIETGRYIQAVGDFRDKYMALPGDFTGAEALWGTPGSCPAVVGPGTGTQTCNGNGDGRITTQQSHQLTNEYEQFRAWQHLANAGLVDGTYTGIAGIGDTMKAVVGSNVPASKLPGGGYDLTSLLSGEIGSNNVSPHYYTNINYMHMLQFGSATGPNSTIYPILATDEASSLDVKLDDGYPSTGKIMAPVYNSAYAPNCSTNASPPAYDMTQTGYKCSLLFLLGY